jgi:hypothetical protein
LAVVLRNWFSAHLDGSEFDLAFVFFQCFVFLVVWELGQGGGRLRASGFL